jgi:hypothetical protein
MKWYLDAVGSQFTWLEDHAMTNRSALARAILEGHIDSGCPLIARVADGVIAFEFH